MRAFVAASLRPAEQSRVATLVKALGKAGFQVHTGEDAFCAGIAISVQERIKMCDVVLALLSRRPDQSSEDPGADDDEAHSPCSKQPTHPWVLEELAFAYGNHIPVVPIIQADVEFGGIVGDLQRISYVDNRDFGEAAERAVESAIRQLEAVTGFRMGQMSTWKRRVLHPYQAWWRATSVFTWIAAPTVAVAAPVLLVLRASSPGADFDLGSAIPKTIHVVFLCLASSCPGIAFWS